MPRTVIITGASSGIGEALACLAARLGYNLCLSARNSERLEKVAEKCRKENVQVICVISDVSKEEDCRRIIEEAVKAYGSLDILINNAGISMRAVFNDCDLSVIKKLMDVNFWGTVFCTKFALPHLLKSKGSVVGVTSIAGMKGLPARTGYSASKFAMHGFLESLRIENLKTGLHVLLACPGYTGSNIRNTALDRSGEAQSESPLDESKLMSAEVVADRIFKAISQRKAYLFLTLTGKLTVFLNKFVPLWLDRMVYKKVAAEKNSPFK